FVEPHPLVRGDQRIERLAEIAANGAEFGLQIDVREGQFLSGEIDPARALAAQLHRQIEGENLMRRGARNLHRDAGGGQLTRGSDARLANRTLAPGGVEAEVARRRERERLFVRQRGGGDWLSQRV